MVKRVTLRQPTLDECQQVRVWRNAPEILPMLRTGFKTEAQQAEFYRTVIGHPHPNHRYYALEHAEQFIGVGGLTYLDRVPGEAEISLMLGPPWRGRGLGRAAVDALLEEAFGPLGLHTVTGECYAANPARAFWIRMLSEFLENGRVEPALHWTWKKVAG